MTTLFLCGDVMTGRGIDQVLPNPSDPALHESFVDDARDYVALAEGVNGPIPRPVTFAYIWGSALAELERVAPDARIINLETSITRSDAWWPDKGIHYRMHPGNIACLGAAGIDCCVLANNHVLDWGYAGLDETLGTLRAAELRTVGAGADASAAAVPAIIDRGARGRVLVFGYGSATSGIPLEWAARAKQPGINVLPDLARATARSVTAAMAAYRRSGDLVVASIHWGANWGYTIPREQREFAHALIDAGVDVVHGHSSHHAQGIEAYKERPILYGCGDFLNDYEGIGGHESYRSDLALMYFVDIDTVYSGVVTLRMVPLQRRKFSLHPGSRADAQWLKAMFERESRLDHGIELGDDNSLTLRIATGC